MRDSPATEVSVNRFREKGYQVIGLTERNRVSDVNLFERGFSPLEWSAIFGLADVWIVERMHACIFSILNNTPFVAVDFRRNPLNDESKIRDLLRSFDLMDSYYNVHLDPADRLQGICDRLMDHEWPSAEVTGKTAHFRQRSQDFGEKIKAIVQG
jgi:polysaccharide pyruvyl transferase WcaK-like protein